MSEFPKSGPLTFLFTDLVDSTLLWEKFSKVMAAALVRHDVLLREAVETNKGRVIKTTGDGLHAVFQSPFDGLQAALDGQRAIEAESWPVDTGPLKVRMGLHTGESQERDGDYYGSEVNRAARVMGIGYGGQILLSETTAAFIRRSPPIELALKDLGEHQLKGISAPEQIYQINHPELNTEFPPLNTPDWQTTNLPPSPNILIGRRREILEVTALLGDKDIRLLTLTGPGGTGKTRLSLEVAREMKGEYENGIFFVPLAPIFDPALFVPAIAETWNLREKIGLTLLESVTDYLKDKQLLLVLDNFEQVLDAGPRVAILLAAAPRLNVLVTSREPLHIYGEKNILVPPLKLPDTNNLPPLEDLIQYEAVGLFVERAKAVKSDFEINEGNATAIAEICKSLDGLPLAIELAAARVRLLPPQEMLKRMKRLMPLLRGGGRDLPLRQQTLYNTISWSHDLLNQSEKILFRRLAVFASATFEAIESICNIDGDLSPSLFDDLESLIDKSLIKQVEADGEARFNMLGTIREYALSKLEESDELDIIRTKHLGFFLKLIKQTSTELMGPDSALWMERFGLERDNLRFVLDWSLNNPELIAQGTKVVLELISFWQLRGDHEEWAYWLDLALDKNANAPILVRANLLEGKSFQTIHLGTYELTYHYLDQALVLYQEIGDYRGIGQVQTYQAHAALGLGDIPQALRFAENSLAIQRKGGEHFGISGSLFTLGDATFLQGEFLKARGIYEESLLLSSDLGISFSIAIRKIRLGQTALALGEYTLAHKYLIEGLTHTGQDDKWGVVMAFGAFGSLAKELSQPERAARLLGVTQALLDEFSSYLWPLDRQLFDQAVAEVRQILGPDAFTANWIEGQAMSMEEANGYALEMSEPRSD
jgi:predicted ATPase/class 3 adenylate cyclase